MTAPRPDVAQAPVPGHRELYLLVAGVILGLLLGPAVLGRLAPQRYARMFPSVQAARLELEAFDRNLADLQRQLAASGATDVATVELDAQLAPQRRALESALGKARRAAARLPALVLALAAVMVVEAAAAAAVQRRLVVVRYSLMALWVALLLAQPSLLADVPILFAGLVLLVALIAAFLPLPGRSANELPARKGP